MDGEVIQAIELIEIATHKRHDTFPFVHMFQTTE